MENPNIKEMKGEELAEILNQAYAQLQVAQGNIMAINAELQRRKSLHKEPTVNKTEEKVEVKK